MKHIQRRLQYNTGSRFTKGSQHNKGFTLIEMLVSVAIFTIMTTYLIVKYGTFNQNILLTNTAYDIALTIRQAQNFGTNTQRGVTGGGASFSAFQPAFGVSFSTQNPRNISPGKPYGVIVPSNTNFVFFPDVHPSGGDMRYEDHPSEEAVRTLYALRRGVRVTALCAGSETSCTATTKLDIAFKRPSPNAVISSATATNLSFARITIQTDDGSFSRTIAVREFGQIAVED